MNSVAALAVPEIETVKISHVPSVGRFERLPKWLNCIPLIFQWLWLSLRYGSISLPSAANPHITCGGMVGEGKLEYLDGMGATARQFVAPFIAITVTNSKVLMPSALHQMQMHNLAFPIIVKPNLGWCGYGVRLIRNSQELSSYFKEFPKNETVLLQRYLPQAGEAGLFYVREPREATGRLIGITLRYFPEVIGDAVLSTKQLILQDERLSRVLKNKLHKPDLDLDYVPQYGEAIRLSTIGSTRVGGLYRDGSEYITPALNLAVDAIARDMPDFQVGRFDVRFECLEKLRQGKAFTIMEINGSGSESVHAWDPKYTIAESYRIIFDKQKLLFEIGAANRRKGHNPIGFYQLAKLYFQQQKLIKSYPLSN